MHLRTHIITYVFFLIFPTSGLRLHLALQVKIEHPWQSDMENRMQFSILQTSTVPFWIVQLSHVTGFFLTPDLIFSRYSIFWDFLETQKNHLAAK